jgi:hypothetical protein
LFERVKTRYKPFGGCGVWSNILRAHCSSSSSRCLSLDRPLSAARLQQLVSELGERGDVSQGICSLRQRRAGGGRHVAALKLRGVCRPERRRVSPADVCRPVNRKVLRLRTVCRSGHGGLRSLAGERRSCVCREPTMNSPASQQGVRAAVMRSSVAELLTSKFKSRDERTAHDESWTWRPRRRRGASAI